MSDALIQWPDHLSAASDEPSKMEFFAVPPSPPRELFGDLWMVYGYGPIDADAGARLTQVIAEKRIPPRSFLFLDSPGGSLLGGMTLGRAIRAAHLFTFIGRVGEEEPFGPFSFRPSKPGACYSAATLAFLGGIYRWVSEGCEYGVHRFYNEERDHGSDVAQAISAMVIEYIREMDVDPALFSEMTKAGRDDVNILKLERLRQLKVVNGDPEETKWTIESFGQGLYLKGERITWRGVNKFMLLRSPTDKVILHVIFDPEGRGEEALRMGAHAIFVDGVSHPIEAALPAQLINGLVNVFYDLSPPMIDKIKGAKTVGVGLQWSYEAPTFLGFDMMEIGEGHRKLEGYLTVSSKQRQ